MSTIPNAPEDKESFLYEPSATPRWIIVVFVILFVAVGYLLYADQTARSKLEAQLARANDRANKLAAQLDQANVRMAELKGQVAVTSQKIGLTQAELARARTLAQTIREEQKASDEKFLAQLGQVKQESEAKISQVSTELGGAKSDIEATKKDLEATKSKLERTIGDLGVQSGLIARSREEVDALKRLGERNIFEFDLRKSKTPQRVGPVQLSLVKADPKKFRYTLTVYADDKTIEKKDRTVNEPVQFYVKGARAPYEVVVFEVAKDRATGYLSTPKQSPPGTN
jgi:multidrug efflux pump subunit AcrA (membrane-fusion protein)